MSVKDQFTNHIMYTSCLMEMLLIAVLTLLSVY